VALADGALETPEPRAPPHALGSRRTAQAADFEAALAGPGDTSEKLFALANRPAVRFSVGGGCVQVVQDRTATEHSGGVVWETAFFLARYMEQHVLPRGSARRSGARQPRVIELGAGCGLLGLALSRLGCSVVQTDQPSALANLRANAEAHVAASAGSVESGPVDVLRLEWGNTADIAAALEQGPFDFVVASDVVFASRFVEPLLGTIAALLAASRGNGDAVCWLCLQQRDPDAHAALLSQAPALFHVRELSFVGLPGFEAAAELECVLLRLRLRPTPRATGARAEAGLDDELQRVAGATAGDEQARGLRPPSGMPLVERGQSVEPGGRRRRVQRGARRQGKGQRATVVND